jgi:hypothetical protein
MIGQKLVSVLVMQTAPARAIQANLRLLLRHMMSLVCFSAGPHALPILGSQGGTELSCLAIIHPYITYVRFTTREAIGLLTAYLRIPRFQNQALCLLLQ